MKVDQLRCCEEEKRKEPKQRSSNFSGVKVTIGDVTVVISIAMGFVLGFAAATLICGIISSFHSLWIRSCILNYCWASFACPIRAAYAGRKPSPSVPKAPVSCL